LRIRPSASAIAFLLLLPAPAVRGASPRPSGRPPDGAPPCGANARAIHEAAAALQQKQRNVGLAIAVSTGNAIVYSDSLGSADLEHRVPVGAHTRFGIASVTKAFTGAAVLRLWERGILDLDADVRKYVPQFPAKPEGTITPRLLAAHLAGIRHWKSERTAELYARHFEDVEQILPLFADDPLESPPGQAYRYSSYGYDLLGAVVQRASGKPYTRVVEEEIVKPLALTETGFDDVRKVLPDRARRYSFYDPWSFAESSEPLRVPEWDYSHNLAAGNMFSTAPDLARFGAAFARPGLLGPAAWRLLGADPGGGAASSPVRFGWFSPSGPEAGAKSTRPDRTPACRPPCTSIPTRGSRSRSSRTPGESVPARERWSPSSRARSRGSAAPSGRRDPDAPGALLAVHAAVRDDGRDVSVRSDRQVHVFVDQEIVARSLPDDAEVVDRGDVRPPIDERGLELALRDPGRVIGLAGGLANPSHFLRLEVEEPAHHVVVDREGRDDVKVPRQRDDVARAPIGAGNLELELERDLRVFLDFPSSERCGGERGHRQCGRRAGAPIRS
jgi:serine beta-lactamase-like protein LACTB, mitochondrial